MSALLVASLALNAVLLAAAGAFVASRGGLSYVRGKLKPRSAAPDAGMAPHWRCWSEQHALVPIRPGETVMLGDSLTEWGDWKDLLGRTDVRNRGIAGDTIGGVLKRLGPILEGRPKAIFLLVGLNDILGGASVEQVIAAHKELVGRIRREAPDTRLVVQSLLPVHPHATGVRHNPKVRIVNQALAETALAAGAEWVDLFPLFLDGDALADRFTYDGLHLSGAGYATWVAALTPLLDRPAPTPA